ncbi:MAG: nucleotidyltransferase domain-containing protein [Candidatus Woesearchaeota archaeon]
MNNINEVFYIYPEKWFHIRKLAKILSISPNTVKNKILILFKLNHVEKRNYNNMIEYRANLDNKSFILHKKLYNLLQIYESGLVDYLKDYYSNSPIILFGSFSRGEDLSTSDIDIAIISNKKTRPNLEKYTKKLHREINLSVFLKEDVSKEFMNNIINGIVLEGVLEI